MSNRRKLELIREYKIRQARSDFLAFRKLINPKDKWGWWQAEIAQELQRFYQDMIDGKRPKLVIQAPPQHGKSVQIVDFIAWLAGKNPDCRTIYTSFSERLGVRANLKLQRLYDSQIYKDIFPETRINQSNSVTVSGQFLRNREILEYCDHSGYFRNTTVGGSITGEGLDCIAEGTLVDTDHGKISIEDLETLPLSVKILAYKDGVLGYERLCGFARRESVGIYRITDSFGGFFECTGDHPVFTQNAGYKAAATLSTSDTLVRLVPEGLPKASIRSDEMDQGGRAGKLLFCGVQSRRPERSIASQVRKMRSFGRGANEIRKTLQAMPSRIQNSKERKPRFASTCCLSDVQQQFSSAAQVGRRLRNLLLKGLRQQGAFCRYVWSSKPQLAKWRIQSSQGRSGIACLSPYQAVDTQKGRQCVQSMRGRLSLGGASYRRNPIQQRIIKPSAFVSVMPQRSASVIAQRAEFASVATVERVREKATTYDITVENAHNFFANGILVHNCGVVDDPIKGRKEANSITVRDGVWDWFTDDFFTRFSDNAALLCILTRWHIDDPIGRLIKTNDDVRVLSYPAIAEHDELHRKAGDALFPEHKSIEFLLERKALMDTASWQSLYQQSPIILGGEIIKGEWFGRYGLPPAIQFRKIFADTAQKTKEHNDYSVFECWGLGDDNKLYLLDMIRGKWEAPELKRRAVEFWNKHKDKQGMGALRQMCVEDKASGTGLIQDIRDEAKIPIKAIQRSTDKLTRVQDVLSYIESGYVMLPANASFVSDFVSECEAFTADNAHDHDDQIDPMCDAINDMLAKRGSVEPSVRFL